MDFKFLEMFNFKTKARASNDMPAMMQTPATQFGTRLGAAFANIYQYFTDTGEVYSSYQLLTKARNYAISDPMVASFIRIMKNQVVGQTGFTLQSKVDDFDDVTNTEINSKLEYEFYEFCKQGNFEVSNRFSMVDFMKLALQNYLIEGEIVIRVYKTGKYGLKLQLLNYDSIDYSRSKGNIINGVEIGQETQPVAYWIKDGAGKIGRVDASQIIHIVNIPIDASNYRGLSVLAPVIPLLADVATLRKCEIQAAIKESTSVLVYKSDPAYGRSYEGAGTTTAQDLVKNTPGATQMAPDIEIQKRIAKSLESSSVRVGSMAVEALPPGVTLDQLSPNAQRSGPEFLKSFYKLLAAGIGVSYLHLLNDLDASTYSGGTQTALIERPTFKAYRSILCEKIMEVVYHIWLTNYLRTNTDLKKINNSYDAYFEHEFGTVGFDSINYKDEVDANIAAYTAKVPLITLSEILNLKGKDLEDHLKTLSKEQALLEKYDLVPKAPVAPGTNPMADPTATEPVNPAEEATDPEEEEGPAIEDPKTDTKPKSDNTDN